MLFRKPYLGFPKMQKYFIHVRFHDASKKILFIGYIKKIDGSTLKAPLINLCNFAVLKFDNNGEFWHKLGTTDNQFRM